MVLRDIGRRMLFLACVTSRQHVACIARTDLMVQLHMLT